MTAERDALAEAIDYAMREHAYSHTVSNSPHNFACSPSCVSEQLRRVVGRELDAAGYERPGSYARGVADGRADLAAAVKALADEWGTEGPSLVRHAHSGRDVHEGSTLEQCAANLYDLLAHVGGCNERCDDESGHWIEGVPVVEILANVHGCSMFSRRPCVRCKRQGAALDDDLIDQGSPGIRRWLAYQDREARRTADTTEADRG